MVEWFCYYDLWSKVKVFGDMFGQGGIPTEQERQGGVKNMLEDLPETFSEQQLEALRMSVGKGKEGTKHQLRVWKIAASSPTRPRRGFTPKRRSI